MPYDGFGNFTRAYNWVADKIALIKIQAARMDAEFDNYATALNQVILRNGVAAFTGNMKLGGNSITGIASGAAATPSVRFNSDVTTGIFLASAGVLGIAANGVESARFTSLGGLVSGVLGITGNLLIGGFTELSGIFEDCVITATAITGTVQIDAKNVAVVVYDSNAAGNFSFNIRGDSGTSLDSIMLVGQSISFAIEVPQGAAAYYCTTITVDGAGVSQLKWFNGGAPTAGNVSGIDVYAITIMKKAAGTFYVRASQSQAK